MWNKRFDFISTPDHRWYVRRGLNPQTKLRLRRGGRTSKPAGETIVKRTNELQVAIRHNLIRAAPFAFRADPLHSNELVALCGWVFSDGSIGKRGRQVDLYQSERANPTKCMEIERLVCAVGGGTSRLGTSDGMRRWSLTGETAAQVSDLLGPDKRITVAFLQRLTRDQADLLYRACLEGDGYTIAGRYDCFIQADPGRAEDFQLLCLFLGRIANIQTYARKTPMHTFPGGGTYATKPKLHVNVRVAQTTQTDKRRMQYETIDVPTGVWCPTTRNQTWVARRAGMVTITGNTAAGLGIDPSDPYASLDAAARMDAQNLKQYGGDWSRTLAAYNAGPGAVAKYGGVPPYEETQRYVDNILQGQNTQASITPSESLNRIGGWAVPTADRVSQFGDQQLSTDEAYSSCGPAAAVRFAQAYGRNPTLREAVDMAKSVGWSAQSGMAGISSEQQLLSKMGIPTKLTNDMSAMAKEAQTGNPVTISTPGHYFYADGYDPGTGAFHVGRSGTDLKGGSEWMTPAQMESVMGKIQGGLLADNPTIPQDSTAQNVVNQVGGFFSNVGSTIQQATRPITQPVVDAVTGAIGGAGALGDQALSSLNQAVNDAHNNQQSQLPGGAFNRLAPGSEGGPPQYTDFGQAAAGSGPTPADVYTVKPGDVGRVLDQITGGPGLSDAIQWQQQQRQIARDVLTQAGIDPDSGVFSSKPEIDPLGTLTSAPQQILSGPQQGNWGLGGTLGGVLGLAGLLTAGQTPSPSGAAARAAEAGLAGFERAFPPEVAHAATIDPGVFGVGGAQPTSGATQLRRALDMISEYPQEIAAPIRQFVASADAPSSEIANTIQRWMLDNPLHTVPDVSAGPAARAAAADVGQQAAQDLADSVATRYPAYRPGGPGPEPGQLGLEPLPPAGAPATGRLAGPSQEVADWLSRAVEGRAGQEPLPTGGGAGGVPSAMQTVAEQQWWQRLTQAAARRDFAGMQDALEQAGLVGDRTGRPGVIPGFGSGEITDIGRLAAPGSETADWLRRAIAGAGQRALPEGAGGAGLPSTLATLAERQFWRRVDQAAAQRDFGAMQDALERYGLVGNRTSARTVFGAETPGVGQTVIPGFERSSAGLPRGVTPDMVDAAHAKLDNLTNAAGEKVQLPVGAHEQLDNLLAQGAKPNELARFFANLAGDQPTIADWIRALRTGSMAGGVTTEGKVLAGPLIQTAMRAPAGALHLVMTGRASDIPKGLSGGLSGLAEGAHEALQTIRYGTNYRSVLMGGPSGGFGFRAGPSIIGNTPFQRALGTVLEGLVRTHGAAGDISAGIGRGANTALGASAREAAEAGQQWAFRSGEYGAFGSRLASMFDALRSRNPAFDVMSQIILPFYRVGYNVFTQGIERSPVGLAGRITDAMQGKPLDKAKLANNLFGVGLAAIALSEASQGNITSEHPEGGAPRNSIRIAGLWFPLSALGPLSEPLAQAAITYESARDSRGNTAKFATQLASSYAGHVVDETWLNSIHDVFNLIGDVRDLGSSNPGTVSQGEKELNYLTKSYGKSFIPQEKLGEQFLGLPKVLEKAGSSGTSSDRPPGALPVYKPGSSGSGSLPVYKPGSLPKANVGR
jgi:hypothetical protein